MAGHTDGGVGARPNPFQHKQFQNPKTTAGPLFPHSKSAIRFKGDDPKNEIKKDEFKPSLPAEAPPTHPLTTPPAANPVAMASEKPKETPAEFFKKLDLAGKLQADQKKKLYAELRMMHVGFWRDQMEAMAKGVAGATNATIRLPLHLINGMTKVMNTVVPPSKRLYGAEDVNKLYAKSDVNSAARKEFLVKPIQKYVDPATLEESIDHSPFIAKLDRALKAYGTNGEVSLARFEKLFEQVSEHPETFKTQQELDDAKSFVASFPLMVQMSEKPDTFTAATLARFQQNTKNSIPFLYEQYGQTAEHYVNANLFHLGVASTLPDVGFVKKTGIEISQKLNEYPTYRKVARWAKENQLSDTQFLPIYSFVDALYAQITAYGTGLVKEFSINAVFEQMVALDGVFNGIGFFITKAQILLVGWEKDKPDRLRAQYEKSIRLFKKRNDELQASLEAERVKLADKIKADPAKAEEFQKDFEKNVLQPIIQETNKLLKGLDKFQLKLDKLLGVKEMGFLEKAWKKPPKLLNDLKYMVPISMALTLPYEYFYFNRYTDYGMDFFSLKFLMFCSYMTALSGVGNVVIKSIIHITQDKSKLYLHGQKDELMAEKTREVLANFQGTVQDLEKSQNPKVQALAKQLKDYYMKLSTPLIGDETKQSGTEKAQNREAKLQFSMDKTEAIGIVLKDMEQAMEKTNKLPRKAPERVAMKNLHKYVKMLQTLHDRASYQPINRTLFDLGVLSDFYAKEIQAPGLEVYLPMQYSQFFKETLKGTTKFLKDLEQKYPRAEMPFEPLEMKAAKDFDSMKGVFEGAMKDLQVDSSVGRGFWSKVLSFGRSTQSEVVSGSIGDIVSTFGREAKTPEEREAFAKVAKVFGKTRSGVKKDLYYLNAKSKEEADQDLAAYRELRKEYAEETKNLSFADWRKYKRMAAQVGMTANQGFKNAAYLDKYNKWFSGYPWIPAHSLLNVAGRLGLTSIVQGHLLPASVMFKVWAFGHIPIRIWTFLNEKFMVMRDEHHRDHAEVENKLKDGMEGYIRKMLEEQQKKLSGSPIPSGSEGVPPESILEPPPIDPQEAA